MFEKAQRSFLRRLLVVGRYSMCAPLFTELGLVPLKYRRLILPREPEMRLRMLSTRRSSVTVPRRSSINVGISRARAEWVLTSGLYTGELFSLYIYIYVAVGGPEIDSLKSGSIVKGKWIAA
ncbi:hypothetical protein R3P38DRAFT_3126729 [Favolaschia claudopus]|uniref:Uncharacterized protein n=1 Tax=Favolaschia claudopus TaxID=2862362 RepID=A0AAV9ZAP8_9AGAR